MNCTQIKINKSAYSFVCLISWVLHKIVLSLQLNLLDYQCLINFCSLEISIRLWVEFSLRVAKLNTYTLFREVVCQNSQECKLINPQPL